MPFEPKTWVNAPEGYVQGDTVPPGATPTDAAALNDLEARVQAALLELAGSGGGITEPVPSLEFAGGVGDAASGGTLFWDEDEVYGLVFKGVDGGGFSVLGAENPDDANFSAILVATSSYAALKLNAGTNSFQFQAAPDVTYASVQGDLVWGAGGPVVVAPDATAYRIKVANGGALSTEVVTL